METVIIGLKKGKYINTNSPTESIKVIKKVSGINKDAAFHEAEKEIKKITGVHYLNNYDYLIITDKTIINKL